MQQMRPERDHLLARLEITGYLRRIITQSQHLNGPPRHFGWLT
jgi:hypothetical protein